MGEHGLAVDVRCDVAHDEVASRAGVVVGDIMAVKSVETVGSTLKRAVGFALFSLLVRQVVLLCTSKEPLSNVQVRILGPDLNSTQTVTTMSLPAWLEDFESTNARRGSGSSGKHSHNFSSLDERAFQKYLLEQESEWKNGLAFCLLPETFKEKVKLDTWPLFARAWLRSFIFANLIYLGLGLTWAYYIYNVYGFYLFPKGNMPKIEDAAEQIKVSLGSLPLYSMLPAVCEYIVEQGWTLAYVRIDQYGWPMFLCSFAAYMSFVEFGVYWNHRLLHDLRVGYDKLHYIHHKYNKENTLSPFAGLAFHPLDGILQAIPYFWTLFVFPMHSLTYELMLFGTGVWTTNIHDCVEVECQPIMGAGYHTIHHTTYRHNYGQFFTYMDRAFGTIMYPEKSGKKEWNEKH